MCRKIDNWCFLNIQRWLNITNITPHGPDDGSVEPKRYSVDFLINISFYLDYFVINFLHIVGLQSFIYFHIYIYIYIYIIDVTTLLELFSDVANKDLKSQYFHFAK